MHVASKRYKVKKNQIVGLFELEKTVSLFDNELQPSAPSPSVYLSALASEK